MTIAVRSIAEAPDYVGRLCVALAHRYEPERRFLILTAYFDESGTHGGEIALVGGFLSDARGWRKFEKRAGKLFARYGVDIFHTVDVKRSDKDFRGWSVDRKIKFIDEFQHIVNETTKIGFVSVLRYDDYAYYKSLNWPKGTRPQSMYALMYRGCLSAALQASVDTLARLATNARLRLHVVVESGHRNAQEIVDFHNHVRGDAATGLAELTFGKKGESLPLAAADLFAYTAYQMEMGGKPIGDSKEPLKTATSYRFNCYRMVIGRDSLTGLHAEAISLARGRKARSS